MFRKHPAQFRQDVVGQHAVFAVDGGGTVGGGTANIAVGERECAVLGEVTIRYA